MNLNLINRQGIQAHTSYVDMGLFLYTGQTFNAGITTPTYSNAIPVKVNVQLYNNQKLRFQNNTLTTHVYKKLFIDYQTTGLNRNISSGGDFLLWLNPSKNLSLKYRVVEVLNAFPQSYTGAVGYTEVIAIESGLLDE